MGQKKRMTMLAVIGGSILLAGGCSSQPRTLYAVRTSAETNLSNGDVERATADATEYVERAPERIEGRLLLGRVYLQQGETAEACEQFWIARALNTDDDEVLDALCEGLYANNEQREVYRVIRERIRDRGTMEDYFRLADWATRFQDMDEARTALLTAASIDGGQTVEPQLRLATFHQETGDERQALERYRMGYWIDPSDPRVLAGIRSLGEVPGPTMPPAELSSEYRIVQPDVP